MPSTLDKYRFRLAKIPALGKFCDRAEELVRAENPETLWSVEPAFQELLSSDFIESFVLSELNNIADNQFYYLEGSSEFQAAVVESAGYSLTLKFMPPELQMSAPLASLTENVLMSAWRESAQVEVYKLEQPFRIDVFDRSKRLLHVGTKDLLPGSVARFRAPGETFRLVSQRPAVMLQLLSANVAPLRWIFDTQTLEPIRAAAARLISSRLQFTCHTLAALGSPTSITALKKLMIHPEHFVRWAAIQSICMISREDGIECLHQALEDDHPHIRNAAQKTLTKYGKEA
ncbi:MAG TPA: HEAT repeat domain-containing protein [Candidatus Angelobacter sp.]|nr:HEAT repeat domain-containing protein [Candidatus Angelobacter sp.]